MDHASLPDHVAGDYRAGRVGYFGFGGHAETGVSGVHHPPRRGSGCLPRGDFRRGGGAVQVYALGKDILLSNNDHGYIYYHRSVPRVNFNEQRDYLYPIPIHERSLNNSLTQNPGWDDGLGF